MPYQRSDALVLADPLNRTFCGIVVPCGTVVVVQEINATDGAHLAGGLLQILEFLFVVLDIVGGVGVQVIVVGAAVLLLSGDDVLAVLIAQIAVQPFGGIGGVGVGELAGGGEIGQALVRRLYGEVVKERVTPVGAQFNGVDALVQHDHAAGGLLEFQVVGEADLPLVHAVDVEILHLFVAVVWLTVGDGEFVQACLLHRDLQTDSRALLVEVGEATGGVGEVEVLAGAVLLCVAFPAAVVDFSAAGLAVLKLVFLHGSVRCCGGKSSAGEGQRRDPADCRQRTGSDGVFFQMFQWNILLWSSFTETKLIFGIYS